MSAFIARYDALVNESEFMDLTHLNETGARRFSKELKARLVSLGLLPRPNSEL